MNHATTATAEAPTADNLLDRLRALPVAVLSDAADSLGATGCVMNGVRRLVGERVAGYARTIGREVAPANGTQADIDPKLGMGTQVVIDSCGPDEVIVISARGNAEFAVWGDNMATRAHAVGVRAVVTDGVIRDLDEMEGIGMAVYAAGTTPRQAFKRLLTSSIDAPVVVAGVMVRRGDVIVADGDGVISIPAGRADEILAKAEAIQAVETQMHGFLVAGNSLVSAVEKYKQR